MEINMNLLSTATLNQFVEKKIHPSNDNNKTEMTKSTYCNPN